MGSTGKRQTTIAKRERERRLLERRAEKQAKKDARKRAASEEGESTRGEDALDTVPRDRSEHE